MRQALSILIVTFFSGIAGSASSAPYMDATLPIEKRVEDLSRMTIEEKTLQLTPVVIGPNDNPNNAVTKEKFVQSKNRIIYLFSNGCKKRNEYQRIAVEETRLGMPLLFAYDVIHGFGLFIQSR